MTLDELDEYWMTIGMSIDDCLTIDEEGKYVWSHTAMEIKTVDKLNYQTVSLILSERDKLRLAGIDKRHPLLFHFDRSLWPILFATMQLLHLYTCFL